MKRARLFAGFIFVVLAHICMAESQGAVKIDDRASINFPGKPDSIIQGGKTIFTFNEANHSYNMVKTTVKESDPGNTYLDLAYSAYSEELNKREGVSGMQEKDAAIVKLPGKVFCYHIKEAGIDKFAESRALYFDGVLYSFTAISADSDKRSEGTRFLNSFDIKTDIRMMPLNTISTSSDIDFLWGHIVFAGLFAVLAFTLYFIWTRNNPSRLS